MILLNNELLRMTKPATCQSPAQWVCWSRIIIFHVTAYELRPAPAHCGS